LPVNAFKLVRYVKHRCKKHNTECRVTHLQSELSSVHFSTVHTGNFEYFVVKLHKVINFR